jgi:hypothetical protein
MSNGETVLKSKHLSYGLVELVKISSFMGGISYWIKVRGKLEHGSYSTLAAAEAKYSSLY